MSNEADDYAMPPQPNDAVGPVSDEGMSPSGATSFTAGEAGEFSMPPEPGLGSEEPAPPPTSMPDAAAPGGGGGEQEMPPVPRAVRLTFAFEGDNVTVVSRQPVEMVARSSDPVSSREARLGSWIELQSEEGAPLYTQVLPEHFTPDVEVFSPEPGESVSREPVDVASGVFSVVIPDIEEANEIAIFSSRAPGEAPPGVQTAREAPPSLIEVVRFPNRPEGG